MKKNNNIVLHIISGLQDGGAESMLYQILRLSDSYNHYVLSLTGSGKYGSLLVDSGVPVISLDLRKNLSCFYKFVKLVKIIRRIQPCTVQTWMYHADCIGGIAAKITGIENIVWSIHHESLNPNTTRVSTGILGLFNAGLSYFVPNKIVAVSKSVKISHVQVGYRKNIFEIIENGVDTVKHSPDPAARKQIRKNLSIDQSTVVVGMLARFHKVKAHDIFIGACGGLHRQGVDFKILLAGKGIDGGNVELTNLIRKQGLQDKVILFGSTNYPEHLYNAMDVHVLSSTSEAFGLSALEAVSCGTCSVSTEVGQCKEFLEDVGFLCRPTSAEDLEHAILTALKCSPKELLRRRDKGILRAQSMYSIVVTARTYESLWE